MNRWKSWIPLAFMLAVAVGLGIVYVSKNELVSIQNDTNGFGVLRSYLDSARWEDRLAFVRNPGRVEPLMAEYFANFQRPENFQIHQDPYKYRSNIFPKLNAYMHKVTIPKQGIFPESDYYYSTILTKSGWKIDWEASAWRNRVSLREMEINPTLGNFDVMVNTSIVKYYNYQYRESERSHYSLSLQDSDGKISYGYIKRDSRDGRMIFDILKKGETLGLVLKVRHTKEEDVPEYSGKTDTSLVEVVGLVSDCFISPPFDD